MSGLSEVSVLIAQRAKDIEKAREIFTSESRSFVAAILSALKRSRTDPWTTGRVKLDFPRDIECEAKLSSDFSSQFALARLVLRFKKGTKFVQVADITFGIDFDDSNDHFNWRIMLMPSASYTRLDDVVWKHWRAKIPNTDQNAKHLDKRNEVRFLARPISGDLTAEDAFNDVKAVLEFVLSIETALAEPIGFEPLPSEES